MSKVALGCIVAVIALIALWVLWHPEFVRGSFRPSSDSVHYKEVEKGSAPATLGSVSSPFSSRIADSEAAKLGKSDAQVATGTSIQPKAHPQVDGGHHQADVATSRTQEADYSVPIGRPFPLSASMQAACKVEFDGCKRLYDDLSTLAQEPRDPHWSDAMETKLRNYVEAESGDFTIRSLECRSSVCAIEVASMNGPLPSPSSSTLDNWVLAEAAEFAYEHNGPAGGRTTVTFQTFDRR